MIVSNDCKGARSDAGPWCFATDFCMSQILLPMTCATGFAGYGSSMEVVIPVMAEEEFFKERVSG
jgi:hypothetical protein